MDLSLPLRARSRVNAQSGALNWCVDGLVKLRRQTVLLHFWLSGEALDSYRFSTFDLG